MEKQVLHKALSRMSHGSFEVAYWDGTVEYYGSGECVCRIVFQDQMDIKKFFHDPVLAVGEGYVDGIIEIEGNMRDALKLAFSSQDHFLPSNHAVKKALSILQKANSLSKQKKDIQQHYDLGNEFFSLWLDATMSYSCAYFQSLEDSLYQAQLQKIDHVLKKLQLKPGDTLLDIGSGWGWLIIKAAKQYQVNTMGITLSEQQYHETKRRIQQENLEELVEVELMDYRALAKSGRTFDKIVSVGMLEHVGKANLPVYMEAVHKMLTHGGLSLVHTITHQKEGPVNAWIEKYIFPGGYIPSYREIIWQLPEYDFHLLDVESLRIHYAMTLDHWAQRFEKHIDKVKEMYDERFVRMWKLYLHSCAASFRFSGLDIHQILFSKGLNNHLPLTRNYLYS
ncbi:SAM-dependent methyltransferase [Clostridium formicaceticum]|uniref:Cyclopropane-fatty-acyl-phospholipid synthase n=2 Tax=Clostridium formicaceticum TaxID=1497 RepID=A0AAC9WIH2_9CLOT|nr:cyclopropane-fatty-acyl-phospholipid synthase family protein [Clostridium formicaceticum]ARE88725.1 Cyclopropane-fatty-acyl-phospholipid synthase [Clostridium formicaceticum]